MKDRAHQTATQVDHRDEAEEYLDGIRARVLKGGCPVDVADFNLQLAAVHAQLAQADAIDRLTSALERMELPALTVTGSVLKGTCRIQTVKR